MTPCRLDLRSRYRALMMECRLRTIDSPLVKLTSHLGSRVALGTLVTGLKTYSTLGKATHKTEPKYSLFGNRGLAMKKSRAAAIFWQTVPDTWALYSVYAAREQTLWN